VAGPTLKAFRARLLYRALAAITFIGKRIPLRIGQRCGRALGTFAWHVLRRERRKALDHIAIAFPEWNEAQRRATIRRMFQNFGMTLFEIVWLRKFDHAAREQVTIREGFEPLRALLAGGRGVFIVSGHNGNWEWAAQEVASLGPMAVMQRDRDDPDMNRFITELRAGSGIHTIDRGSASSARELLRELRKGSMLVALLDQNIRAESAKVPFFGKPALTPIGIAKLAISTESAVVPIFDERLDDGRQLVRILDPIPAKRGDDPIALTAQITTIIEQQIRRAPHQWVWMHDRWRERPKWEV